MEICNFYLIFPEGEKPEVPPDKLVNIQIPPTLRKQLVDDCEFITHLGKLVKLPRTPNVNDIMKNYFDYRLKKCGLWLPNVPFLPVHESLGLRASRCGKQVWQLAEVGETMEGQATPTGKTFF
ncbi:hypothetical protein DS421_12g360140 [Arachis hypogaea]|nr:hypothetical protein DS421_12g360140 [Arachis hypogaea]